MDSLLDALQEGRLIEFPDNNKEHSLRFLAHILEAIPSLPAGTDVAGVIMSKEGSTKTALGKGWACPDARVAFNEDLICVVGWSPTGIDYGAPDGIPVKIIAMYLVPENQRSSYLREVSLLAKAIEIYPGLDRLNEASELNEVRDHLLDLISSTKGTVGPDTRARMIQLQARPSVIEAPSYNFANLIVEPVTIITCAGAKPVVLAHDRELVDLLDSSTDLAEGIATQGKFQNNGWCIVKSRETSFQADRALFDCLAIKETGIVQVGK
ncbi:PTS sugar transporter subunit IIA [uncultured Desulfobulbus sp.]|uniref:PTS sugar transporter subunit IIA n=1 Tax=uncultured Desulfobulbus sp. TaxID=239745 RepID=UPI0029C86601|nr:PTS sugar transporter subunit IIA [uncultured Desulfobulbus sp.]